MESEKGSEKGSEREREGESERGRKSRVHARISSIEHRTINLKEEFKV